MTAEQAYQLESIYNSIKPNKIYIEKWKVQTTYDGRQGFGTLVLNVSGFSKLSIERIYKNSRISNIIDFGIYDPDLFPNNMIYGIKNTTDKQEFDITNYDNIMLYCYIDGNGTQGEYPDVQILGISVE